MITFKSMNNNLKPLSAVVGSDLLTLVSGVGEGETGYGRSSIGSG